MNSGLPLASWCPAMGPRLERRQRDACLVQGGRPIERVTRLSELGLVYGDVSFVFRENPPVIRWEHRGMALLLVGIQQTPNPRQEYRLLLDGRRLKRVSARVTLRQKHSEGDSFVHILRYPVGSVILYEAAGEHVGGRSKVSYLGVELSEVVALTAHEYALLAVEDSP